MAVEYPLAQKGGTEALVRALLVGLNPHFEVVLVSGDESPTDLPPEFSSLIAGHLHWNVHPKTASPARQLAQELCRQKIQLAHFHFGETYAWGSNRFWRCPVYYVAKAGVPCASTNHLATEWLNCGVRPTRPVWQKQLYQLFAIFSRSQIYRGLKFEICVSRHDQRRMVAQFPFFKNKTMHLYHSLLDASEKPPPLDNREATILNVGHLAERKGSFVLAEAFSKIANRHPGWRLQFAGSGENGTEGKKITRLAQQERLDGRIQLLGPRNDATDLMRRAAIYVQPSFKEALGLSLQEALFYGCPAVGTRAGGIPELIEDGKNGLLVETGNVDELAAALERMISDEAFRLRCATAARSSILDKGMTAANMIARHLELYAMAARS